MQMKKQKQNNKANLLQVNFCDNLDKIYVIHHSVFRQLTYLFKKNSWFFKTVVGDDGYDSKIILDKTCLLEEYENLSSTEIIKLARKMATDYMHYNRKIMEGFNKIRQVMILGGTIAGFDNLFLKMFDLIEFKKFILFLMKKYNVSSKIAYAGYKRGITDGILNLDKDIFYNIGENFFIRVYGNRGVKLAIKFFNAVCNSFEEYIKEENAKGNLL